MQSKTLWWLWKTLGLVVLVLLMMGCGDLSSSPSGVLPTQPVPTPTITGVASPTQIKVVACLESVTTGRPHVGGPLSDFPGAYGQPWRCSVPDVKWILQDYTLDMRISLTVSKVTVMALAGTTWDARTQQRRCDQYLPDNVTFLKSDGATVYYNAPIGTVMVVQMVNACTLSV